MSDYELVINEAAVPKARPRLGRDGNTYTPAETAAWEKVVGWLFIQAHGKPCLTGPVSVTLSFHGVRKVQDIDNLAKGVLDGLNGIAYLDDRQVTRLVVDKQVDSLKLTSILVSDGQS